MSRCVVHAGYAAHVTDISQIAQQWLQPNWPAIAGVQALFTTRHGGFSLAPCDAMNLGDHVQDDPSHVAANRALLTDVVTALSGHSAQPIFMQQVHGCEVQSLHAASPQGLPFDACVTDQAGVVCTVMVADCLPVLFAHCSGAVVAAAHAGWRGLVGKHGQGVIEATWQAYAAKLGMAGDAHLAAQTQVWLGPCIGAQAFEVGDEVRQSFVQVDPDAAQFFVPSPHATGKWLANLPALARQRLLGLGVENIYGNDGSTTWCTVSNPSLFFSHRRDAGRWGTTGRMAACIWKI